MCGLVGFKGQVGSVQSRLKSLGIFIAYISMPILNQFAAYTKVSDVF